MAQKPALGKGLASLFPNVASAQPSAIPAQPPLPGAGAIAAGPPTTVQQQESISRDRQMGISMIPPEDIQVNPFQPRRDFDEPAIEELSQSIKANGIIQPLVVRKTPQGTYQLIAGERRLRAAKAAGLRMVPIVIRKTTDREALELALIENIQRQNLNCIDEALAYFQLMQDFSLTQEEVSQRVGKDRASVANHVRLLRLPEAIIDDLKRQILSFGHGKALLGLDDNDLRLRARAQIVERRLSVRDAEELVDALKRQGSGDAASQSLPPAKTQSPAAARLHAVTQELTRHYSAKVEIKGSERRGRIVVHYGSRQELERLLEAMQK